MRNIMKQISYFLLSLSLLSMFIFGVFGLTNTTLAQDPPLPETSFQNQNTDFLPAVPKIPDSDTTDLFDDSAAT
jgi:hypothetical protein